MRLPLKSFFFLLLISLNALSQVSVKDSALVAPMIKFSYSPQIPAGDMKERFGLNSNIGADFQVKTKSNWIVGFSGSFMFGSKIKEEGIFSNIQTSDGLVINSNGLYSEIRMYERGFITLFKLGKVFPVFSPNPNSGIMATLGTGFIQHKIRIEDVSGSTPQLTGEYIKGYDRLTNGLALSQFIGYLYLGNTRLLNGFVGFEITEGFTQNRRSFNFSTMERDSRKRMDILYGIRFGIIVPLYKKIPDQFYYN